MSGPRDARQPEGHLFHQATLHQPVAVTGHQERHQQDGQFSLRDTMQKESVSSNLSFPSASITLSLYPL